MPETRSPNLSSPVSGNSEILTYEEGLKQVRRSIEAIFKVQNLLAIAINASGSRVRGRLFSQLVGELTEKEIPVGVCTEPSGLLAARDQLRDRQERFNEWLRQVYILHAWSAPHGVRSFEGEDIRRSYDAALAAKAGSYGIPLKRVDLWVGLSDEENPFPARSEPYDPFEDILIHDNGVKRK